MSTVRSPSRPRMTATRAERGEDRVEVLGRVGLAERAADRAAVAHRRVGDHLLGLAHDREVPGEQVGLEDVAVARQRADPDLAALLADVAELGLERVDVDQVLGRREPQLHHRQQRVAAGDEPGLRAEPLQQRDRLVDARRARVVERRRYLHVLPLLGWACRRRYSRSARAALHVDNRSLIVARRRDVHPAPLVRDGGPPGLGDARRREALGVSEPAVSSAVAALRRDLGDALFVRAGGGIRLTPGGERLAAAAAEILGLEDRLRREVGEARGERGLLRLAVSPAVAEYVSAPLLDAFTRRRPTLEVAQEVASPEATSARCWPTAAPTSRSGRRRPPAPGVEVVPFLRYKLVVVAAPRHRLAGARDVPLGALRERALARRAGAAPSSRASSPSAGCRRPSRARSPPRPPRRPRRRRGRA